MPNSNSKSRQDLLSRFVRNAIPSETDFADLIKAGLNQADDGLVKLPDQPLGLVRQKPDQPVLRFYADPTAEGSAWQLQLGSGDKPGFGLAAADGKLALFVDGASGNVGIGTAAAAAGARLTIQGDFNATKDPQSRLRYGGVLGIKSYAPTIDFIDTDTGNQWAIHVNESRMYFVREPWENEDLVLDGRGSIGMGCVDPQGKLNIRERTGTPASALQGTLLLDHEDAGGASSIVFRSKVNRGSDYAFIEFRDKNLDLPLDPSIPLRHEASLLTIGVQNDLEDHIALMPSGNVGIGTTKPGFKLDVNGPVRLGGFTFEDKDEWPNIIWCRDTAKNWDEGLIKHGKSNSFFNRAGFGIHTHESRSFEVFSTGLRPLFGIEGGSGNAFIRGQTNILTSSNPIRFSSRYTGFPDDKTNGAEICNDTDDSKTLMLVGNKSNGGRRRVSVWDDLEVNGNLKVIGKVDSQNARIQATAVNRIDVATETWTDMPQMIVTANIDGPVLVLFKVGGVQGYDHQLVRAYFRLLIDGNEKALATQEFHNGGWELRDVSLVWLESSLAVGNHVFKVQWRRAEEGRVFACWYGDLRSLIVVNL